MEWDAIQLGIYHLILLSLRIYDSKRLSSRWKEIFDGVKANSLATAVFAIAALLLVLGLGFMTNFYTLYFAKSLLMGVGGALIFGFPTALMSA